MADSSPHTEKELIQDKLAFIPNAFSNFHLFQLGPRIAFITKPGMFTMYRNVVNRIINPNFIKKKETYTILGRDIRTDQYLSKKLYI